MFWQTCCTLWRSDTTEDSDDEVFLWVKAELMRSDGDAPELKGRAEIYSIIYPTGVSLWLSVNPRDLQPDLELLSLHTTSGSAPEGINSSVLKKKKKNHCQDVHEGILAGWKETLKLILLFLAFSA